MSKIVLLTGPPGSGKTTIAREIAKHFPKCLHIQVDQLREMMASGLAVPSEGWIDETTQQFEWARSTAVYMAELYADQEVFVIVDDVSVPDGFQDHYVALFDSPRAQRVLLLPSADKLVERMQSRAGAWETDLVAHVPWFYSYLDPMSKDGWIVLDTGDWTVEQTVRAVLERIGVAPAA